MSVFVFLPAYLPNYMTDIHQFFVHVTDARGSVLWWCLDMLYTSGFSVMSCFAHNQSQISLGLKIRAETDGRTDGHDRLLYLPC